MGTPKNILILKYRAMGDALIGLGGVAYLRQLYPDAHIVYGVPKWVAPLFQNVGTAADEILPLELKKAIDWWHLWRTLRSKKIDLVYEMFQSGRTEKFFKLYSALTGVPYHFHNHHKAPGASRVLGQGVIKPVIQRDLDGIYSHLSAPTSAVPHFLDFQPSVAVKAQEPWGASKVVVLGVVATRQTKMWPLENYRRLALLIQAHDPAIQVVLPLSASAEDQSIERQWLSGPPSNSSVVKLPLAELFSFFASAKLYVGNDTGLKHIAIAAGTKTVTLFGPEPPLEWHPYPREKHPYFFWEPLECRTRTGHYCGLKFCDSMICLSNFTPEQVFLEIKSGL